MEPLPLLGRGNPPLNGFLINLLNYIECALFQLQPNSVVILTSLCVIFQSCHRREPQPQEIRFLYTLRTSHTTSASVISLEAINMKVIEGIKSNVGPYKAQWFFVRYPAPCYREFRTGGELIFNSTSRLIFLRRLCLTLFLLQLFILQWFLLMISLPWPLISSPLARLLVTSLVYSWMIVRDH